MINILGINDKQEKLQYFTAFVDKIEEHNVLPELDPSDKANRIHALMDYSEYSNVYTYSTDSSSAFAIAYTVDRDPHFEGRGMIISAMLAYGTGEALKRLMFSLMRFAKELDCQFIAISHRVAPFEYRCRYKRLR